MFSVRKFWDKRMKHQNNNAEGDSINGTYGCTRSILPVLYEDREESTAEELSRTNHTNKNNIQSLEDFHLLKVIGKGCMGKVLLAREKSSDKIFAIKSISKKWVLSHGMQEVEHIMAEQRILAALSHIRHPFLIRLHCSFQTMDNLFLILEYVGGGDLATQLEIYGRFNVDRARFYCAEMVSGILELHRLGIIYRDLKPENVLIGPDGHIKLTDFGLSKQFRVSTKLSHDIHSCIGSSDCGCLKTKTFCGTAEYLAPEILLEKPYSFEVDWWSLGTFLYEMVVGVTPFWAENHAVMYQRVLGDPLEFPPEISDNILKSFIQKLLVRNPTLRLGYGDLKGRAIRGDAFFVSIDWNDLVAKKYQAPFIPRLISEVDVRWFDKEFTGMSPNISPAACSSPNDYVPSRSMFKGYTYLSTSAQKLMSQNLAFDSRPTKKKRFNGSFCGSFNNNGHDMVIMSPTPGDQKILEDDSLDFTFEDL